MAFSDIIAQWVYTEKFLTALGGIIILLSLSLLLIIFIELRVKKTVKIKLNQKGISYLKQIDKIRKESKKPQQTIKEINSTIKEFLKEYLKLNSTPTYGEALEMIEGKKQIEDLRQLCTEASSVLYAGEKPSEEKVEKIIDMFENIVKYRLIKLDEQKAKEIEKIMGNVKEEFIDERKIRMIMSTIKSGKKSLAKANLKEAYQSYGLVNALYKNLNQKEKEICRKKIVEFYAEIAKKTQSLKAERVHPTIEPTESLSTAYSSAPTAAPAAPESPSKDTPKAEPQQGSL